MAKGKEVQRPEMAKDIGKEGEQTKKGRRRKNFIEIYADDQRRAQIAKSTTQGTEVVATSSQTHDTKEATNVGKIKKGSFSEKEINDVGQQLLPIAARLRALKNGSF